MRQIGIHPISFSVMRLEPMCGDQVASSATGFLWKAADATYLVTNWHCLTGINPTTGQALSKSGARPDSLLMHLPTDQVGAILKVPLQLFDNEGEPLWRVHPTAGEQVDIAVIPFVAPPTQFRHQDADLQLVSQPLNQFEFTDLLPEVAEELSVVGFPRNLHRVGLPLWKGATLASEPEVFLDVPDLRELYIDCASREGMSGSPVIVIRRGTIRRRGTVGMIQAATDFDFLGVYSGRIVDLEEDPRFDDLIAAQIGVVWPKELVERVIAEGKRDTLRRESAFKKTIEQSDEN